MSLDADDFFTRIVETDKQSYAIFEFNNKLNESISKDDLEIDFYQVRGNVAEYEIEINATCQKKIKTPIIEYIESCMNVSGEEICTFNETVVDYNISYKPYKCWEEFSAIPSGLHYLKISAEPEFQRCGKGVCYAVDWVPSVSYQGDLLIKWEWDWWNASYTNYIDVENEISDQIPVALNGTEGWESCGYNVYTDGSQCDGQLKLYYNSCDDIALICNDTTKVPFEISQTNSGHKTTDVYGTGAQGAYHFDNNSIASGCLDSTYNSYNCSVSGATWTSSGYSGGAFSFDGSNDYLDHSSFEGVGTGVVSMGYLFKTINTGDGSMVTIGPNTGGKYIRTAFYGGNFYVYYGNGNANGGSVTYADGNWHTVDVVRNGSQHQDTKVYYDGTPLSLSYANPTSIADVLDGITIGARPGNTNNFLGVIDEVYVEYRALSASEIEARHDSYEGTSMNFGTIYQSTTSSSCDCPGLNENWDITEDCNITTDCNIGTGILNITPSFTFNCSAQVNISDMVLGNSTHGGHIVVNDNTCNINVI